MFGSSVMEVRGSLKALLLEECWRRLQPWREEVAARKQCRTCVALSVVDEDGDCPACATHRPVR